MTVNLILGVTELPYQNENRPRAAPRITKSGKLHAGSLRRLARQSQRNSLSKEAETTGDVAELLEARYHVFEMFFTRYEAEITAAFVESMENALVNLMAGAPPANNPYGDAEAEVERLFTVFIESEELAQMGVPGIPTKAALKGVNHRLKHPYARGNPRRTSLIDSGLFASSFTSWVEGG